MLSCAVCKSETQFRCRICHSVAYCSKKHQLQDLRNHKFICFPITIEKKSVSLRKLVTSKFVLAGEVLFKEAPYIVSPFSDAEQEHNFCFVCGVNLHSNRRCPACNWPICSKECSTSEEHQPECRKTKKRDGNTIITTTIYRYIFVIRCIYNPDKLQYIYQLLEPEFKWTCRDTKSARADHAAMQEIFDLENISFTDIQRLLTIFNFRNMKFQYISKIGIYDKARLISHSCMPNVYYSFNQREEIIVKAARCIPRGSILSMSYVLLPCWDYNTRKLQLMNKCRMTCNCRRCRDWTDIGTYTNSVLCKYCQYGNLYPPKKAQVNNWTCGSCSEQESNHTISNIIGNVMSFMPLLNDRQQCEEFLAISSVLVSENHFTRLMVKTNLVLNHWKDVEFHPIMKNEEIDTKLRVCKDLLRVYDKVYNGLSTFKGELMRSLLHTLGCHFRHAKKHPDVGGFRSYAIHLEREMRDLINDILQIYLSDSLSAKERYIVYEVKEFRNILNMYGRNPQYEILYE